MLLCVFLVWPTEFANILSFCAKQIWCLWTDGKSLKILILGKLGLKLLFLKNISSHTHAFCSSISMLWRVSKLFFVFFKKKNCVFSKILWASICFDWSSLFFNQLKLFLKNLGQPLSVLINRNWFSINRKSWIRFF